MYMIVVVRKSFSLLSFLLNAVSFFAVTVIC